MTALLLAPIHTPQRQPCIAFSCRSFGRNGTSSWRPEPLIIIFFAVPPPVALARSCVRPRRHSPRPRQVSLVCIATGTVSARRKFCVPSHLRFTALAISSMLSTVVSLTPDALRAVACCHFRAFLICTPRVDCSLSPCGWVCSFACSWLCSFRSWVMGCRHQLIFFFASMPALSRARHWCRYPAGTTHVV